MPGDVHRSQRETVVRANDPERVDIHPSVKNDSAEGGGTSMFFALHAHPRRGWTKMKRTSLASSFALWTCLAMLSAIQVLPASSEPAAAAASAPASGTYENTSPLIRYAGNWVVSKDTSGDSGRNSSTTNDPDGSATFTFNGTGFDIVARKNPWLGIAAVSVDSASKGEIDHYSSTSQFGQTVLSVRNLTPGDHTVVITRTGTRNSSATTRQINLDAVRVVDSTAPSKVTELSATARPDGASLSWKRSDELDVTGYEIWRRLGSTGNLQYIESVPRDTTTFVDAGIAPGTAAQWTILAVDSSGLKSGRSSYASAIVPQFESPVLGVEDCPSATVSVSNAAELRAALKNSTAGTSIRLAPGMYAGAFSVSVQGKASAPLWICGPQSAVIDNGGPGAGYGIHIYDSSYVNVVGVSVQNVRKGISVSSSSHVIVSQTRVRNIGEEALHLRYGTTDSVLVDNRVSETGKTGPTFGEGVYVGTDPKNWCAFTGCEPDRSDRNLVIGNTISGTTAEPIEVKAGSSNGVVRGNTVDASGTSDPLAGIAIKGNDWVVEDNTVVGRRTSAIIAQDSSAAGWGMRNTLSRNVTATAAGGIGVWVRGGLDNIVSCDNVNQTSGSVVTNVRCQR